MRVLFVLVLTCYIVDVSAQSPRYKFDFGSNRTAPGYIGITADSKYNEQKGYGFSHGSVVSSVDRGGNTLTGDYITSAKPFYFSVKLPEGNYDVKLVLGDTKGISAT